MTVLIIRTTVTDIVNFRESNCPMIDGGGSGKTADKGFGEALQVVQQVWERCPYLIQNFG